MKTEINVINIKHKDILQKKNKKTTKKPPKHLDEVKEIQSILKQTLLALREIEKSTEESQTIKYSSSVRMFRKFPAKICVNMLTFK